MIEAICWVLVHSLWQGVLLALAGGGVILCTKRSAAAVRYRLLCGLLGLFLAGLGVTFVYEWTMVSGSGDGIGAVGVSMSWLGEWCSAHAVQIVGVWSIITIVKSIRMAAGWKYMWRMRREGVMAPALWVERMDELRRRLDIRRTVKLVESALVRVPIVIGQLRPIIYIPLGLINHLPASEMEAVLLHELAHIRRYDFAVNMVQHVVECLLFFNPGFLWISSLLREERENCCDDIAIAHTRDRVEFVRTLVRFSENSLRGMALAFPGNKRQLLHRVLRISRQENKTLSGRERLVLLAGCIVLFCLLMARVGRADVQKTEEPVVSAHPVKTAPAELVSVLRTQEQVAQNMEWVEAQLDQLHHKSGRKVRNKPAQDVDEMPAKKEQAMKNREQVQMQEQAEMQEQTQMQEQAQMQEQMQVQDQAVRDRLQAEEERAQGELDRSQAERDRDQAEKNRVQVEKNRQRVEQNRVQVELNRQQVLRNLEQDKLNKVQALRDHEQAARDLEQANRNRERAERDRIQAELDRQQADRDREQVARDRVQAETARQRAEMERAKANLDRQLAELNQKKADPDGQKSKNN
jgi:bla regulator protein blaR1